MSKLLAGRRVLVVEDEMVVLMNLEDMLADLGCEAVTAVATVAQACTRIGAQTFDLAVLDVNLNGHKSYPVADALAARGVPFIFSTGYGERGVGDAHRDRPVLQKPFHAGALAEALTCLLSG